MLRAYHPWLVRSQPVAQPTERTAAPACPSPVIDSAPVRTENPLRPQRPVPIPPSLLLLLALANPLLWLAADATAQVRKQDVARTIHIAIPIAFEEFNKDKTFQSNISIITTELQNRLGLDGFRYIFLGSPPSDKKSPDGIIPSKVWTIGAPEYSPILPSPDPAGNSGVPWADAALQAIPRAVADFNQRTDISEKDRIFLYVKLKGTPCLSAQPHSEATTCAIAVAGDSRDAPAHQVLSLRLRDVAGQVVRTFFQEIRRDELQVRPPSIKGQLWTYATETTGTTQPEALTQDGIAKPIKYPDATDENTVRFLLNTASIASHQPLRCNLPIGKISKQTQQGSIISCDFSGIFRQHKRFHGIGMAVSLAGVVLLGLAILPSVEYGNVAPSLDWPTAEAYRSAGFNDNRATLGTLYSLGTAAAVAGTAVLLYGYFGNRDIPAEIK